MSDGLGREIADIAGRLPRGATFEYEVSAEGLFLLQMRFPRTRAGDGTRHMAEVLAAADRHGVGTFLQADPSDEPGNPCTFELVRWYARFGFEVVGVDANDWVEMSRPAAARPVDASGILAAYGRARDGDLTREGFDAVIDRVAPRLRVP